MMDGPQTKTKLKHSLEKREGKKNGKSKKSKQSGPRKEKKDRRKTKKRTDEKEKKYQWPACVCLVASGVDQRDAMSLGAQAVSNGGGGQGQEEEHPIYVMN